MLPANARAASATAPAEHLQMDILEEGALEALILNLLILLRSLLYV